MHRDLKSDNIMLDKEKNLDQIKIIDFGFSRHFKSKEIAKTTCGTLSYCAPEIFKKNYTEKCDIWSCGVLTFALLSGILPFSGLKDIEEAKVSFSAKEFDNVSEEAKSFITLMLTYDQEKRPSADEAL